MNYKYVISFLGSKQQKDWAKPRPDWVYVFDHNQDFEPLVKMFPDDLKIKDNELIYKDGSNVHWGWISNVTKTNISINLNADIDDLSSEAEHIFYEPSKKIILFCYSYHIDDIKRHLEEIADAFKDEYKPATHFNIPIK